MADQGACIFNCNITNQSLSVASRERLSSIIGASKKRQDGLHISLKEKVTDHPDFKFEYHRSCVSTYTSSHHIERYRKKHGIVDDKQSSQEPPRKRRSLTDEFQFKKHCLFCGKECLSFDPKHPNRQPVVLQCRTIPKSGPTFKETILRICAQRGDKQAEDVRIRVLDASSDLHAADAEYHKNCYSSFVSERNVHAARVHSTEAKQLDMEDGALANITKVMEDSPGRIWTSTELHAMYEEQGKASMQHDIASRRHIISKLRNYYGKELMIMNIEGCASLLCFKHFVPHYLKLVEVQSEEDLPMDGYIQQIRAEATSHPKQTDYDLGSCNLSETVKSTSPTLLSFVSLLVSKGKTTRTSISLAQSIQSHITKSPNQTTLGLAVKMHHKFGSREANDILRDYAALQQPMMK